MNDHANPSATSAAIPVSTPRLRRILEDDDAHVPLREAHALDGSTRSTTLNPKDLKQLHFLLQRFRELFF